MRWCTLGFLALTGFGSSRLEAGGVGVPKKEEIPKYVNMLRGSPNPKERAFAAEQIGRRGAIQVRDVKSAIDPLLSTMKGDNSPDVRRAAITALGNIGTQPKVIVPALVAALKDKSITVNLAAVSALGQYGMEARSAVPALREFSKGKKDKKIMRMVNQTIKQINARVQ